MPDVRDRSRRPDVTVIAVAYESGPQLAECLVSVTANAGDLSLEVFVVDNGSSDGCVDDVRARVPGAVVLGDGTNVGYGGGVNVGFAAAAAPFILVVNPDTAVRYGTLDRLVAVARRRPDAAVIRPQVEWPDGSPELGLLRFPSVGRGVAEALYLHRLPGAWRVRALREIGHTVRSLDAYEHEASADWLAASVLLFRTEAVRAIGGFDDHFFLYWEETDWCRRAHDAGWDVVFSPAMTFVHTGGTARNNEALFATYVASAMRFFDKHYSPARAVALRSVMAANFRLRLLAGRLRPSALPPGEAERLTVGLEQLRGAQDRALRAPAGSRS